MNRKNPHYNDDPLPKIIYYNGKTLRVSRKLGCGSFGVIYRAINIKTKKVYAVKFEKRDNDVLLLELEYKAYKIMNKNRKKKHNGIPKI